MGCDVWVGTWSMVVVAAHLGSRTSDAKTCAAPGGEHCSRWDRVTSTASTYGQTSISATPPTSLSSGVVKVNRTNRPEVSSSGTISTH